MQTAKENIEKTICWLMDRGISPKENLEALKEVILKLEDSITNK